MIDKYYLETTGDYTDRTAEITEILGRYGVCVLGAGLFCVKNINMPERSTLSGMGAATRLLLDPKVEEGYAVNLSTFCTVKDMAVIGSEDPIALPDEVGMRHGVVYIGTATRKDWREGQPFNATVSGCFISSFSGGGITGRCTGYHLRACLSISECHVVNCGAGLNFAYLSEYHKVSNVICNENLYGCINNGGNNTFVGCSFDGNKMGFMIDNRDKKSPNNSHGTVVGCSFNHTDENKGIGILVYDADHGYIFSDCQCFYSKIVIERSSGIMLSTFNFGKEQGITVTGGNPVRILGCTFADSPVVTLEEDGVIIFDRCIDRKGNEIT